jgi:feruloyl-CoA synthase
MTNISNAPFRHVDFAPIDLDVRFDNDGIIRLTPNESLPIKFPHIPAYLRYHSEVRPDKVWLSQRAPGGGDWIGVTFAEARAKVDQLTQALLDLRLPEHAKMMLLSNNSIENALIGLAGMQAGVIVAPVSVAYALLATDYAKLKEVVSIIEPDLVFVDNGKAYQDALAALGLDSPIIAASDPQNGQLSFSKLAETEVTPEVDQTFESISPDGIAKLMFTSGSTGTPKAVPQTHHALVVAVVSNLYTMGELNTEGELRRLDWAPWSHVMGATGLLLAIVNGGSSFIDDGRPMPGRFNETIRNLKELGVSCFVTLPAAYNLLIEELEADDEFAQQFFTHVQTLGYGGAALPAAVVERIQRLSIRQTGYKVPVTCGYGATETGPTGAFIYWATDITGLIGLPYPGVEMKLVPLDADRYEVRLRGEALLSGYYKRPDLNSEIFDEEAYYKIGDTVRLANPDNVLDGLVFAGRLSEEFKLQNGSFVLVGSLRLALLKAVSPLLMEVVLCGENQAYLGALGWLNLEAARKFTGLPDASLKELNRHSKIREAVASSLARYNEQNSAQTRRIRRFILLDLPPSIDSGEMTDKGSVNQRKCRETRSDFVLTLFDSETEETLLVYND